MIDSSIASSSASRPLRASGALGGPGRRRRGRLRSAVAVTASAALTLAAVLVAAPAAHAAGTTLQVGSTADAAVANCTSITSAPAPLTLRTALCIANNTSGSVLVNVPAGLYTLTAGALEIGTNPGSDITIAGAGNPVVRGDGSHQVMTLDPDVSNGGGGGVTVSIDGLTITGGKDALYGGGAIVGGAGYGTADSLTVTNSTISNNSASVDNGPGGGIQFVGGSLTVQNTNFSGNTSGPSGGGAIAYQAQGSGTQSLSITGSTFTANSAGQSDTGVPNEGGAIQVADGAGGTPMSISNSTFTNNLVTGDATATGLGGAIAVDSGALTVTGSTFTGNSVSGPAAAGAAIVTSGSGSLVAHYNRIAHNTGGSAVAAGGGTGTVQATENWWGCSGGPGTSGCDTVAGISSALYTPYLTLHAAASPALIASPATTSTVTADLLTDSAGGAVAPANLGAFTGATVAWSASGSGAIAPASSQFLLGVATATYTASAPGAGTVTAAFDSASLPVAVGLTAPPAFTSGTSATFVAGTTSTFDVTASGYPTPAIALASGSTLPTGLTLTDLGGGHATISGTAAAADGGTHTVTLVASAAGPSTPAQQQLTITITAAPAFTSANTATFAVGTQGTFLATASGSPAATIGYTGALPSGVTAAATSGTLTITGTPAAGSGGSYPLQLTASNGVGAQATQTLTITVTDRPTITSADNATFIVGQNGPTFTFTASGGYPALPHIQSVTGPLPAGLSLAPSGSNETLSGTPSTGTEGVYTLTVTATNGTVSATQTFTLTVNAVPTVSSQPGPATTTAGSAVSFTAAAAGFPVPTVQWQLSTDGGSNFSDVPGAISDTLSFTATQSQNGTEFRAVFTNAAGTVTSDAVLLTVGTGPAFTSGGSASFSVGGGAQSVAVTTSGIPDAAITASGIPGWLTLTPGANGTATLSGDPAAGTGGTYAFTLTASNGFGTDATQTFTMTVTEAPSFTSATSTTMTAGTNSPFAITTSHAYPALTAIALSGALPAGVSYVDGHDGTATLTGAPTSAAGGVYHLTLTTTGGVTDVVQHLTLTVLAAPSITSAATATFTRGVGGTFTIETGPAYPTPILTMTGTLPAGLTFTDNGDGTATIGGTTTAAAATIALHVTASNGTAPDAVQALTLTVAAAAPVPLPAILPLGGQLHGVPAHVTPGETLHVSGSGFAPFAPVLIGFYSTPLTLGTATADASGSFTATISVPAGTHGAHTVAAAAVAPDGAARYLTAATTVDTPSSAGSGGASGTGAGSMADTGLPENAPMLALFALLILAAGIGVLVRTRLHRRP